MKRTPNLRQIEALKAVIECGTVSRAAELLHISQPAVSKLLAHLEEDTELQLFDRVKGRLTPSSKGLRLYEEVDRIFGGIRQIERAVERIRQEEIGRVSVGVMPALSGQFTSHVTRRFLLENKDAHVTVVIRSSQFVVDWLLSKQVDIGLVNRAADHPDIECLPLSGGNFVCLLPNGHRLAAKEEIWPQDIDDVPFIALGADNRIRQKIESMVKGYGVRLNYVVDATLAPAICDMVATGIGISILDPMFAYGQGSKFTVRPFRPDIESDLSLCWLRETPNHRLVDAFVQAARATVAKALSSPSPRP